MLRLALALALAVAAARAVDFLTRRSGLDPPGFRRPRRRAAATALLTFAFFLGIFVPATHFDVVPQIEVETLEVGAVFQLQALFLLTLAAWLALGYGAKDGVATDGVATDGVATDGVATDGVVTEGVATGRWWRHLGLRCRHPVREIGLGLAAGLVAWFAVLTAATLFALLLVALGGDRLVERTPPEVIVWMAALPVAWRLLISLAAGVVEELFFRGFLQRRIGIGLSTGLFVAGHLGYGQPFMLVGLTLLSLFYALLVRWRGNIWAAVAAHFLFDAIQLLVVIPAALELVDRLPAFLGRFPFC